MHPDTEAFLTTLRFRMMCDGTVFQHIATQRMPDGESRGSVERALVRGHAARIVARLHSLRDWPQPGRPA